MNAAASSVLAEGYLKGFFDVLDALLTGPFNFDMSSMEDLGPDELDALSARFPVVMKGRVQGAGGTVLMFGEADASRLVALIAGEDPDTKTGLATEDLATLKEIADSGLGAGVSHWNEKFETGLEYEGIEVARAGENGAGDALGDSVTRILFTFSADGLVEGEAVLLFDQVFEEHVPQELVDALFGGDEAPESAEETRLSPEEMSDILSGFGDETPLTPGPQASQPPQPAAPPPPNVERVLDISLTATARLGRVEMPLGEILALGPGSIIEVGHLVDEPIELLVNGKLIARGDVIVVDEKFGLRITEIVSPEERIESLHKG